jgi:hypothetical protein
MNSAGYFLLWMIIVIVFAFYIAIREDKNARGR